MPTIRVEKEVDVEVDAEDIANGLTREEVMEFIKELDGAVGDWGFTEDIIKELWRMHKADVGDDLDMGDGNILKCNPNAKEEESEDIEDEEDEDTTTKVETTPASDHLHVYRGGVCHCGALP